MVSSIILISKMNKCCIKRCDMPILSKSPNRQIYFALPKNKKLRQKWLDAIGPHNLQKDKKPELLCSFHFRSSSIIQKDGKITLAPGTVPTLNIETKRTALQPLIILDDDEDKTNNSNNTLETNGKRKSDIALETSTNKVPKIVGNPQPPMPVLNIPITAVNAQGNKVAVSENGVPMFVQLIKLPSKLMGQSVVKTVKIPEVKSKPVVVQVANLPAKVNQTPSITAGVAKTPVATNHTPQVVYLTNYKKDVPVVGKAAVKLNQTPSPPIKVGDAKTPVAIKPKPQVVYLASSKTDAPVTKTPVKLNPTPSLPTKAGVAKTQVAINPKTQVLYFAASSNKAVPVVVDAPKPDAPVIQTTLKNKLKDLVGEPDHVQNRAVQKTVQSQSVEQQQLIEQQKETIKALERECTVNKYYRGLHVNERNLARLKLAEAKREIRSQKARLQRYEKKLNAARAQLKVAPKEENVKILYRYNRWGQMSKITYNKAKQPVTK